jgi:intracellular sulfur oxidation DsrE/DsrF family protein
MSQVKLLLMFIIFFSASLSSHAQNSSNANISLSPLTSNENGNDNKYVFDVVIHEPDDMALLLDRIEQLSKTIPADKNDPALALVLHGPEISFFTRGNYSKYMNLVNRAASLDKKGIIDVKVCDTMIRALNIDEKELPDFVEHVPYGPSEVERLVKQGFIKM